METRKLRAVIALVVSLLTVAGVFTLVKAAASGQPTAEGQAEDVLTVCPAGPPDCEYTVIQDAVDAAGHGDVIKVATGLYTDIHGRAAPDGYYGPTVITQVVYLSKTVTVRGGYTLAFADPPDPEANPTTLDAGGQGRVLVVAGNVSPTVEGLRITGGDAAGLGGYYDYLGTHDVGGGVYVDTARPTIRDNHIFDNSAELGGGLFLHKTNGTFSGNTVTLNTASDSGGGLNLGCGGLFLYESSATLSRNTVSANSANGTGGGLCLVISDATLVNNLVVDNRANNPGSGLHITGSSPRLLHNTIASNGGGDGGAIHVTAYTDCPGCDYYYSTAVLTDTILVSHTTGVYVASGNTATLEATLWGSGSWANDTDWGGEGTIITGTVNVWGDPAFVDPDAGDYHIDLTSAAVDTGVNAGVTDDIDGHYRPFDGDRDGAEEFDIGADELVPHLDVTKQAHPHPVQAGGPLTYTIRVTNTVKVDLIATVTDILPAHILTGRTPGGTLILPGGVLTWTPTITAPGGVWVEMVVITVETGYSGPLTNEVRVTTEEGAIGGYVHTLAPNLELTKQAFPDPVQAGEPLTYTISVKNTGDFDLHAKVTDSLPAHVTPGGVLIWEPTIIAPGGLWTQTVVVTVEMGYSGPLTNIVRVGTEEDVTGVYTATSYAEVTPKFDVTKQAHPDPVQAGEPLTYTIRMTNTGNIDLHATITDMLPTHVTPAGTLTWEPTITAPGSVWTQQVVVTAEKGYSGTLTNVVRVTTLEGATGSYTATSIAVAEERFIYLPLVVRNQ